MPFFVFIQQDDGEDFVTALKRLQRPGRHKIVRLRRVSFTCVAPALEPVEGIAAVEIGKGKPASDECAPKNRYCEDLDFKVSEMKTSDSEQESLPTSTLPSLSNQSSSGSSSSRCEAQQYTHNTGAVARTCWAEDPPEKHTGDSSRCSSFLCSLIYKLMEPAVMWSLSLATADWLCTTTALWGLFGELGLTHPKPAKGVGVVCPGNFWMNGLEEYW
eukprot:gnl/TRDRNA2_/TRDRNA2_74178_c0_seq1.p1 gnl/TRDRNA2_/TRDRNA2_74178_c0~~gnl/TRDRNA2_/TRDRNA2_74178_c0_seq1.p1  ORF type:complete len:216 (+),score=19.99 gnl/TRDRNA2_/TRDRNA2_74178_c0_seq1:193-840(+)